LFAFEGCSKDMKFNKIIIGQYVIIHLNISFKSFWYHMTSLHYCHS